ncbi:hypothetical protein C8J35_1281, partial [Rhizobium sp. PP-F2F-G38]
SIWASLSPMLFRAMPTSFLIRVLHIRGEATERLSHRQFGESYK